MTIIGFIGPPRRRAAWVVPLLIAVGCGSASTSTPSPVPSSPTGAPISAGTLTLTDDECTLDARSDLDAGPVRLAMVNEAGEQLGVHLYRLRGGHGFDEFAVHVAEEMRRSEVGEAPLGHPTFATLITESSAGPGSEAELDVDLTSGTYAIGCILFRSNANPLIHAVGPIEVH